jgi:hypothetical protein
VEFIHQNVEVVLGVHVAHFDLLARLALSYFLQLQLAYNFFMSTKASCNLLHVNLNRLSARKTPQIFLSSLSVDV